MDVEQVSEITINKSAGRITCSILPYSISPPNNDVYFLLGRESGNYANDNCCCYTEDQETDVNVNTNTNAQDVITTTTATTTTTTTTTTTANPNSVEQNNTNNLVKEDWCDFGGGAADSESFEDTAARECIEESIGSINFWNNESMNETDFAALKTKLTNDLKELKFTHRIILCINHGAPELFPRKYHICYVKQIPWQPHVQDAFSKKYKFLKELYDSDDGVENISNVVKESKCVAISPDVFNKETNRVKLQYLEKNDIMYWNFEYLSHILSTNRCGALRSLFVPLLCIVMHHFGVALPRYRVLMTQKLSPLFSSSSNTHYWNCITNSNAAAHVNMNVNTNNITIYKQQADSNVNIKIMNNTAIATCHSNTNLEYEDDYYYNDNDYNDDYIEKDENADEEEEEGMFAVDEFE